MGKTLEQRERTQRLLVDIEQRIAEIRSRLAAGRATGEDVTAAADLAESAERLRVELGAAFEVRSADGERPGALLAVADLARRDALASWLDEAGLRVVATTEPATARKLAAAAPDAFDLLVCDVELNGGSGLGLAAEVRHRRPEVPVLLVSAAPPESLVARIPWDDAQGETLVLERAISQERLTAVVRELLRAAAR